ncbi:MAG: histidine kinase [Bacteroidetes bacterium]|nr:histidine kinase [Bacteroidota bacterium]
MKVRWKEHEIIFATMATTVIILGNVWSKENNTELAFKNANVPFNFFVNVLMPGIGRSLSIYLAYLFVNLFTIPRLLFPRKFEAGMLKISLSLKKIECKGIAVKIFKGYVWFFLQIVLITLILGTAFTLFIYYQHEWLFHYPGFSFLPVKGHTDAQLINTYGEYLLALVLTVMYTLYACIRDIISSSLAKSNNKSFLVLILNQLTGFMMFLFILPIVYYSFDLTDKEAISTNIMVVAIPGFLLYLLNAYWLFPANGQKPFFNPSLIVKVLAAAFITMLPFGIGLSSHYDNSSPFFILFAFQLFVMTPISWLHYQQRKEKILELRGLEAELAKSKTDIQFLRSQINPHFLFNTLNTLYGTALQEKAESTASGIQKLGDIMRFMLHENNLDFIQMNREIEYLQNYISLQKLRTQSSPNIVIEDNIHDAHCKHKIAPMLLIPLVENAFKHGISLQEKSWIRIKLECDEKNIRFEVHNSMHAKKDNDPEKDKSGIGFKNVIERLKLVYGGRFQISTNGNGKEFFVKLAIQPNP